MAYEWEDDWSLATPLEQALIAEVEALPVATAVDVAGATLEDLGDTATLDDISASTTGYEAFGDSGTIADLTAGLPSSPPSGAAIVPAPVSAPGGIGGGGARVGTGLGISESSVGDYGIIAEISESSNADLGIILEQATLLGGITGQLTPEQWQAVPTVTQELVAAGLISKGGGVPGPSPAKQRPVVRGGQPMVAPLAGLALQAGATLIQGFLQGAGKRKGGLGASLMGFAGQTLGASANGAAPAPGGVPGTVAYTWQAGAQTFYRLQDGRIATLKQNGMWKVWRPRRHIVISNNPRINQARRVIKLARRLERRLPAQRRPRAHSSQV